MAPRTPRSPGPGQSDPDRSRRSESRPRAVQPPDVKRGTSAPGESSAPADEAGYREFAAEARRRSRNHADEDSNLLAAANQGDQRARESLVNAHLDWVVGAAAERTGRGLSEGDLFQEGSIGLLKAIADFQDSGRSDFEAFAREEVARHMDRALSREDQAQEDGRKLVEAAEAYERAEVSLRRELGRDATPTELAAKLEWSPDRTARIGELVTEARREHDEELLTYLDPEEIDVEALLEASQDSTERNGGAHGAGSGRPEGSGDSGGPRGR